MKKEREEMVRKKKHLHKFCIFQRRPVEKEKKYMIHDGYLYECERYNNIGKGEWK